MTIRSSPAAAWKAAMELARSNICCYRQGEESRRVLDADQEQGEEGGGEDLDIDFEPVTRPQLAAIYSCACDQILIRQQQEQRSTGREGENPSSTQLQHQQIRSGRDQGHHPSCIEHRLFLEDWNRQFNDSERKLARKQASCSSARSDLYQILGLFFVFQGVVLTAVAQTNQISCCLWYLPFTLSFLVFVAASISSIQKLNEIAVLKEEYLLERSLYRSLYKSIEKLKEQGRDCDLDSSQPQLGRNYTKDDSTGKGTIDTVLTIIRNFISVWILSYAGGVLFLLFAFSGVTLFAVKKILCDHTTCPSPAPSQ